MESPMPSFHNGAVEIAYLDEGEGDPILLVHGFASSKNVNWVYPGWVSELQKNGRRVIALDNRGHGESAKLYDPEDYHIGTMAGDVTALMNHLNIERADMMGYSLGGRMTAYLAYSQPRRLRAAILGGIGIGLIEGGGPGENVAEALEAPSLDDVTDPVATLDDVRRSRRHCRAGADRGRHRGRNRRIGRGARKDHPGIAGTRYSQPRPYAGGRRQGLQSGGT
jgi:pimeloyl-ACP methyl ester carboxylesterase